VDLVDRKIGWKSVRPIPNPKSKIILPSKDERPNRKQNIMQCDGNHSRELAAPEDPSGENRE
jgi:hypothetical protein